MKLLLQSTDRALLLEKHALLQSKGVLAHVDDVPHAGAVPSHLYVVLDRQFEDARALMQDASHPVSQPVTEAELAVLAEEVRAFKLSVGNGIAEWLLIAVLSVMSVGYIASRLYD